MSALHALLALGILLGACAPGPPESALPIIRASAQGDGNSVESAIADGALSLDIWSNRGTGSATVELLSGPPPTSITLRLHLRAMEELRVTYGETTLVATIASDAGHEVRQSLVAPDGSEQPLEPANPLWMEVQIVSPEREPVFPLREGHLAINLPDTVLREGKDAFSIRWVDFFR